MSNNTTDEEMKALLDYYDGLEIFWFTFIGYWELCVWIIGTPLNFFVIFIWSCLTCRRSSNRRHSQSRNQWFILSMTCADLIFCSISAPITFLWFTDLIPIMPNSLCYVKYISTHLSNTASSLSILFLNIDKFIYLHWPLHYHSMMTRRKVLAMTLCGWTVAITWALLFVFVFSYIAPDEYGTYNCTLKFTSMFTYPMFLIIIFVMPVILSACTSTYIVLVAVKARMAEAVATSMVTGVSADQDPEEKILQSPLNRAVAKKKSARPSAFSMRSESLASYANVVPWRTITFVFTSTIWSTITYLPYRIFFTVSFLANFSDMKTKELMSIRWSLFAIMVLCAVGNPIITIVTQPNYRARVVELFKKSGTVK